MGGRSSSRRKTDDAPDALCLPGQDDASGSRCHYPLLAKLETASILRIDASRHLHWVLPAPFAMRWALSRQISSWVPKIGVPTPGTRVRIVAGSAAVVAPISAATTLLSLKILASAAASGLIGSTVVHLNQSASSPGYIVLLHRLSDAIGY